ncbi:MAG: hypothetical protein H5U40_16660, partial [Polyangiaceae bacterium]|nr:hypothetical protein [Polyangiaceae bacterium]
RFYLDGEWGIDDSYRGSAWRAVKLERSQPDQCYASVRRAPEGEDALPDYEQESGTDGAADDEL